MFLHLSLILQVFTSLLGSSVTSPGFRSLHSAGFCAHDRGTERCSCVAVASSEKSMEISDRNMGFLEEHHLSRVDFKSDQSNQLKLKMCSLS